MYLNVKPISRIDASKLADHITKQIVEDTESNLNEFPTWEAMKVTLTSGPRITGFKNSGQLEDLGLARMISSKGLIKVVFVQNSQAAKASEDQKSLLLCRFANMLRSHFGEYIDSISLLGL